MISEGGGSRLALGCDILADIRAKIPLAGFVLTSCGNLAAIMRSACANTPDLARARGRALEHQRRAACHNMWRRFRAGLPPGVPADRLVSKQRL